MSLDVCIKKHFPSFTLDIDIQAGSETLGFLGASGCGKSLTMRCIAGIETPDEGRIAVNDRVFFDSQQKINLKPQERKTALLFQNYMLFPNLTIAQNVGAGIGKDVSKPEKERIIKRELSRFGLDGFEERYPSQLSGGQQQRVALARMLAARPGILMLDEPFSALDSHLKGMLEQNLANLFDAFDGTILYVSHDIDEALRFCDRIAVVEAGHILEVDSRNELVNDPHSGAAIKLSGCKNCHRAEYVDDHTIFVPLWGITLHTAKAVPQDIKYMGIRARFIQKVQGAGQNNYHVRVVRVSDSRFERSIMLEFLDTQDKEPSKTSDPDEIFSLKEELFWKMNIDYFADQNLPEKGDEFWVHLDEDRIYLATC